MDRHSQKHFTRFQPGSPPLKSRKIACRPFVRQNVPHETDADYGSDISLRQTTSD
ncbi:MAG TPA: hypothetical protein PKY22_04500 [Accumulibacter sp.]|nr:hypothetical protein [Accumulibacter sp.]